MNVILFKQRDLRAQKLSTILPLLCSFHFTKKKQNSFSFLSFFARYYIIYSAEHPDMHKNAALVHFQLVKATFFSN